LSVKGALGFASLVCRPTFMPAMGARLFCACLYKVSRFQKINEEV